MKILSISFVITLFFTLVYGYLFSVAKFVLNIQNEYQASGILIARNDKFGYIDGVNNEMTVSKFFSNYNVFSMFTSIERLAGALDYYDNKIVRPYFVIFLRFPEDFQTFVNITRTRNINIFSSLIIFSHKLSEKLMNICEYPKENYFNLVFNTKMLVYCHNNHSTIIKEWYSLYPNKTEVAVYAVVDRNGNLVRLNNKTLYQRRNSLNGITLRVTNIKTKLSQGSVAVTGFFGDIIKIIATYAKFSIKRLEPEEAYGIYNPSTKQWNGVIGQVVKNKTDIGVGDITITQQRLDVVDFSEPVEVSYSNYFVKKPNVWILSWSMYYKAFGRRTAYIFISIIALVPLLIGLIILEQNKINSDKKGKTSFWKIVRECYLDVWAIFCKIPIADFSDVWSVRIAYFSLCTLSFLLSSVYSAMLTSYLTVFIPILPFDSMQDFIKDGSYKLLYVKHTSYEEAFKDSNSKLINILKHFLAKEEDLPFNTESAVEKVCNGTNLVFLVDDWTIRSNDFSPTCELVSFHQGHLINMAFVFGKDSPYVGLFNHHLQRMRVNGVLNILRNRNMRTIKTFESNYQSVTLWSSIPIFAILALGIVMSFIFLICENIYFYASLRQHKFAKSRTNYWKPLIRPVNNR